MHKDNRLGKDDQWRELPWIAYIIAFLIGVLLFLFFGKAIFGVEPNLVWISLLMGLAASAIVFWIWGQIHKRNKDEHDD